MNSQLMHTFITNKYTCLHSIFYTTYSGFILKRWFCSDVCVCVLASSHGKEVVDANPISTSWRDRDSQALPIGLDSLQSWSTWSSWSQCSQTCGGHVIRSRTCSGVWDPVEGDKSLCPGARMQYKSCRPCTSR